MSNLTIIGLSLTGAGLLGAILIIGRKIPTLLKLPETEPAVKISWLEEVKTRFRGIRYSAWRPALLDWCEKNLRRLRVSLLKIDNFFIDLIKRLRERADVWRIRSKAWMEHTRLKKREQLQVLESLDKNEVSESIEKVNKEVAEDEDEALEEKIENLGNGNGNHKEEEGLAAAVSLGEPEEVAEPVVLEEEQKCIDLIGADPKNVEAYRNLGFIYLNQKNYSDARACFRRVLKRQPEDQEVKNKLEEIKGLRSKKTPN